MRSFAKLFTLRVCAFVSVSLAAVSSGTAQVQAPPPAATPANVSHEAGPPKRIPRQLALTTGALDGTVREQTSESATRPVIGAHISLRNLRTGQTIPSMTSGDGVFRIFPLSPGVYEFTIEADARVPFKISSLSVVANEVMTLEVLLSATPTMETRSRLPRQPDLGPPLPAETVAASGTYREFRHRLDFDPNYIAELAPDVLPPIADVFGTVPNRWALEQPDYRRYAPSGEYLYTKPHWYDPFNRNRFKGD